MGDGFNRVQFAKQGMYRSALSKPSVPVVTPGRSEVTVMRGMTPLGAFSGFPTPQLFTSLRSPNLKLAYARMDSNKL